MRFSLKPYIVPLIVASALFMEQLDSTVIATALPVIAQSFGENPLRLNLAITAYLLSLGIFLPLSGWIADRFGARTVFCSAIAIFTLGSIGCALADSLASLVLARVVQGMGGAMMVPVGRLVILRVTPKADLIRAMAWLTVPALLGPITGPLLGGFIATYGDWRWIFLINIPIGLLGIVLAYTFIENSREFRSTRLDLPGYLMVSIGLAATMFAFENIGRGIIPNAAVFALLAAGLVFLFIYAKRSRRIEAPIIDLTLFRVNTFSASVIGGFFFRMGIGALPFLLPMMLQIGFGLTPFASGLITFAGAAGAIVMKFTAGPIIRRFGFRPVLLLNTVICAIFMGIYAFFTPATPWAVMVLIILVGGFFRSLQFTILNTLGYADIEASSMSRATTLASVGQQLSLCMGVGLGALLLHAMLAIHDRETLSAADFAPVFLVIAAIGFMSIFFFWRLSPNAGEELRGSRISAPQPAHDVVEKDPIR